MSEQSLISKPFPNESEGNYPEIAITELLQEIQATPRVYWSNLLLIVRLFRESVTSKPVSSDNESSEVAPEAARAEQIKKNQAAIELLRSWREYGDEQEQTETWEYLRQALDEDRLSNRPLFP
ncbi:MAG: hypothetical protein AB4352_08095 [Hormoscilla sp.]